MEAVHDDSVERSTLAKAAAAVSKPRRSELLLRLAAVQKVQLDSAERPGLAVVAAAALTSAEARSCHSRIKRMAISSC